ELQAVFESAADLIVVTDAQGNIYRMNRPAAALVPSLDPNSRHRVGTFARLLNFRKLDGSRLRREEFATIRALSGEAVFGAVRRATAPDGRELVLQINAAPIRNADGTVAGAVAAARDITELYQAQECLREALTAEETQRRRLSAVIQAMPQPVLLADAATGRVVLANQGAAAFWDPESQQVALQSVYDACIIDGAAGRREQHPLYAALHVGATFTREMQVRDRDGRHVPMLVTAAPVLDRQGRPAGAVCVFQPIGELKEKERQLEDLAAERARLLEAIRHEQQFLDAITASMTEGLLVIDREGTLAHCNPKASALLGRPLERLVGRPVSRLWQELGRAGFRPDDLDRLREALASPRDVPPFELTVPGHGGREVRATVFPIHNGGRTPLGSGLLLHDLTPEREAERLQSRFLSLISQELRTPLAVIKGTVTTLLQTADVTRPEELADSLNLVDQQSDRLHHLIGGILDMARIEAGALKPAVRPLDLAPLVREAVAARERADPDAAVRVHVPAQLPPVMGDPARLRQVLDHLLDNALRHARHPDGVTITAEADGGVLRVVVSDDGEGIPPQEQERIFRRFYQVRQAPPGRRYGGLGLGLAICRGIVEAHGGRIWVESQPGKGTAFTFTLPLLAAEAEPAPEAARPAARLVQRERKQQILVVDDDVQTVRLLTTSLKPLGFTVVPARTGEAALELIQLQPPDLVILELSLPDMTGFDLCRQIRQLSGVPVLVLTAREGVEDKATALDLGADDYLTKPFSVTELAARIRVALRRAESAETVRAPDTFTAGRLHINFTDRAVMVDGRPVAVTATEYRLLRELALNAGRVLTQEQILTRVWGESYSNEGELLRSYIRRLRSKLDDRPPHSTLIRTHRGIGYGLVRP
ncbi:MAG TPA: ATP-binding protein, partial [Dehalococcoidia bacterium]